MALSSSDLALAVKPFPAPLSVHESTTRQGFFSTALSIVLISSSMPTSTASPTSLNNRAQLRSPGGLLSRYGQSYGQPHTASGRPAAAPQVLDAYAYPPNLPLKKGPLCSDAMLTYRIHPAITVQGVHGHGYHLRSTLSIMVICAKIKRQ